MFADHHVHVPLQQEQHFVVEGSSGNTVIFAFRDRGQNDARVKERLGDWLRQPVIFFQRIETTP